MAVLKAACPECDTKLRLTVEGEGDHDIECPKCGRSFTAVLESDEPPAKTGKAKKSAQDGAGNKAKAARRRDDDDDDTPRRRKRNDETDGGKTKLIVAGVVAGVLALAGLGGIIYVVASKDKDRDQTAKNTDSTPAATQQTNTQRPRSRSEHAISEHSAQQNTA